MSLRITRGAGAATALVADRRLYLNAAKDQLVEEGAPDAAFLLAPQGTPIEAADVARLGLELVDGKVVQPTEKEQPEPEREPESAAGAEAGEEGSGDAAAPASDSAGNTDTSPSAAPEAARRGKKK